MKNKSLNVLKAVCAILIVFNHCHFTGTFGNLIVNYGRIAVPIFFMISGFFCFNKTEDKIKKKLKHILIIFIWSSLFWFIFDTARYFLLDKEALTFYLKNLISIKSIIKTIIFNTNFFHEHLWFINALIYCYLYELICNKVKIKIHINIELVVSILLLIAYQLINIFIIKTDLSNIYLIKNFIFVGFPFFIIGKYINTIKIEQTPTRFALLVIIFLIGTSSIEILTYQSELYISSIFLAIYLFVLCIKKKNANCKILEYIGDKLSMYMYVIHPAIKYIILYIYTCYNWKNIFIMNLYPILTLMITILISYMIVNLKNKGVKHDYN